MKSVKLHNKPFALLLPIIFALSVTTFGQTTEFTYQGKLLDGALPPTANYDFEFRLFAVDTGGTAIITVQRLNVAVAGGVFTVKLDFGANFGGGPRWLETAVRPAGGGAFTTLTPRQAVTSAPYAIRSLNAQAADTATTATTATNATQLGGVAANQYVLTGDSRLSDARPPTAGSSNYIQNTTTQQPSSNFNIAGNGTAGGTLSAGIVNAATQFNLGGQRLLSTAGFLNLFAGINAGTNTTSTHNAFFGSGAGSLNTTGSSNAFFGALAGQLNTTGNLNAFFGSQAGGANTTGEANAFFGSQAGGANTTGNANAFFGSQAGQANSIGIANAFFGYQAGYSNITGNSNAFFGTLVGNTNTTGGNNAFFGNQSGTANTTGNFNSFFGNAAGLQNTIGESNAFFGRHAGYSNITGNNNTLIGTGADVGANNLNYATAVGAGAVVSSSNTIVLGRADGSDVVQVPGKLQVDTLGTAGSTALCLNGSNRLAPCSSSLRYKTDLQPFTGGFDIINRLRPITFTWRDGGLRDVGLGAEEVERVEPLLVTYNKDGQVEGVKYDRVAVVLLNAVNEQQAQIRERERQAAVQQQQIDQYRKQLAAQQTQLTTQQRELDALKRLLCGSHPRAQVCKAASH